MEQSLFLISSSVQYGYDFELFQPMRSIAREYTMNSFL